MFSYHEAHRTFPPGILSGRMDDENRTRKKGTLGLTFYVAQKDRCEDPSVPRASALTLLLPHLTDRGADEAYNFSLACCAIENATATSASISSFLCPSNGGDSRNTANAYFRRPPGMVAATLGVTDYGLSIGGCGLLIDDARFLISQGAGSLRGVGIMRRGYGAFNIGFGVRREMIKDGTGFTFLMGEIAGGLPLGVRNDGTIVEGDQRMQRTHEALVVKAPWSQGFVGGPPRYKGGVLQVNAGGFGSVFAATAWNAWYGVNGDLASPDQWFSLRPNEEPSECARPNYQLESTPYASINMFGLNGTALPGKVGSVQGFRTRHDAAPMLFADGTVRWMSLAIDSAIWVGLSSVVGREPLPEEYSRP
jgi:hypothetical protein